MLWYFISTVKLRSGDCYYTHFIDGHLRLSEQQNSGLRQSDSRNLSHIAKLLLG